MNFKKGLNKIKGLASARTLTGKELVNYESMDSYTKELMTYYNDVNADKQDKIDNRLTTDSKDVVSAINELKEKPSGEKVPIGSIVPFASDIIPLGYLLCDGREIQKKDYPELWEMLQFGGKINEEEFRRLAKNEVPVMASNNQEGFTLTSSGVYNPTFDLWKAFDRDKFNQNNCWITTNGQTSGWLQIDYPFKRALSSFELTSRNINAPIKYFKLCGIIEGKEVTLKEETITFEIGETKSFVVNSFEEFEAFKCYVTCTSEYANIQELELFTVDMSEFPNRDHERNKKYLPDLRGQFLKGNNESRELLSWQNDAIRNIVGGTGHDLWEGAATGAFYEKPAKETLSVDRFTTSGRYGRKIEVTFDASRAVPTADENRPKNISVNFMIKAINVKQESIDELAIDELNKKIETNKVAINNHEYEVEQEFNRRDEEVILWEGSQASGTVALKESAKNFDRIQIVTNLGATYGVILTLFKVKDVVFSEEWANAVYVATRSNAIQVLFNTTGLTVQKKGGYNITKITGIGRLK